MYTTNIGILKVFFPYFYWLFSFFLFRFFEFSLSRVYLIRKNTYNTLCIVYFNLSCVFLLWFLHIQYIARCVAQYQIRFVIELVTGYVDFVMTFNFVAQKIYIYACVWYHFAIFANTIQWLCVEKVSNIYY